MNKLLLTCEHAGNRIPAAYTDWFAGAEDVLQSHRGWDPGALDLARHLARSLGVLLYHVVWSRLLVESNRSPTNPRIWSRFTKDLRADEKARILETYWWPHRRAVEAEVREGIKKKRQVIHVAIHSFTPELHGEVRNADVSLLYDSARPAEQALGKKWANILGELDPTLRVRRNYPYLGRSDGLTTWLRKKFPERHYLGIEFEMNQAYVGSPAFAPLKKTIAKSIRLLMGVDRMAPPA